jgi:hypothetical protein
MWIYEGIDLYVLTTNDIHIQQAILIHPGSAGNDERRKAFISRWWVYVH